MAHNILQSRISFPDVVYIVGTAYEDTEVYAAIPDDAFIIVCNGAIECPLPNYPAIWMCGDPKVKQSGYFSSRTQNIRNSGYDLGPESIKAGGPVIPVLEREEFLMDYTWVKTYFEIDKSAGMQALGAFEKSSGKLRIQGSIAGAAVQLAIYMGATSVRLVGVRLHGTEYFDGGEHPDKSREDNEWPQTEPFKWMVDYFHTAEKFNGTVIRNFRDMINHNLYTPKVGSLMNILDSNLRLPHRVFIVGTGPNGVSHYDKIKPDDYTIVVNGAIGIEHENIKPDMWICADGNTAACEYFPPGCQRTVDEKILRVWSGAVTHRANNRTPDYFFRLVPYHEAGFRHVPDKFRPDETVAGIAIDLAYKFGAGEAILCGIDMGGDKYWDESDAPGNVDDDHGDVWCSRDRLDEQIAWMHLHGFKVSTISETKLKEPHAYVMDNLPSVALMCFAFNPVYTKTAIFCAYIQNYPDHLKTLYLITQNGNQPNIGTDLPFRIVQIDIAGAWTELWLLKLRAFLEVCTEDYVAIFDEDDFFTPGYISKAIEAITDGGYEMVWNFDNRLTGRFKIVQGKYRSPFGQIVVKREHAFNALKELWQMVYDVPYGSDEPGREYGGRGCQDKNYHNILLRQITSEDQIRNEDLIIPGKIGLHTGERWYRYHLNANTCSGRIDSECIDFWMPGIWYNGTPFQGARYTQRFWHKEDKPNAPTTTDISTKS